MATAIEILLAAAPLVLIGVLLIGLFWPATRAMPIAWVVTLAIGYVVWNMPPEWLAAASIGGVMTAIEILWIVFGALVLLYTLMEAGAFDRINRGFVAVSDDRRVQIVLLGFFMATFIEGAAGFGTPAAVVAPLLLGLGFPALAAVVAALIGHIIAVTYGAVGTPIVVGITDPLGSVESTTQAIQEGGYAEVADYAVDIAAWAATYHALVGFLMPMIAVSMVVYFFGEERSLQPAFEVAPLCLFAGIAFAIPYWTSAWFLTAEFPSLIGSMVGGAITISVLRAGYLRPDTSWDFPPREEWPSYWVGDIEPGQPDDHVGDADMSLLRAWSPYIILVVLLVITRAVTPISDFINRSLFVVSWEGILGTTVDGAVAWMNVPGFWLLVSAVIAVGIYGMSGTEVKAAWTEAVRKIASPFVALIFVIATVQVMLQSGSPDVSGIPEMVNEAGNAVDVSMIDVLALTTADILGPIYPFFAALIGALGAALAGSNTVSNITFSNFQFTAAQDLGLPTQIIVGAQAVGGAMGNLIAIHNVVAAVATVGLIGEEGRVMRLNLIPLTYYATMVGVLALLFSYVLFPGIF